MVKQSKGKINKAAVVKKAPETAKVGALKVSHRQVWTDLLAAGWASEKLAGQPLEVLMGLWKQLHPDQYYCPLPPKQMWASAVATRNSRLRC